MPNITNKTGVMKGATARPGNIPLTSANIAEITNVATLDTDLLANGYTAAQLIGMTENDKIYAWRIKNGLPHQ